MDPMFRIRIHRMIAWFSTLPVMLSHMLPLSPTLCLRLIVLALLAGECGVVHEDSGTRAEADRFADLECDRAGHSYT